MLRSRSILLVLTVLWACGESGTEPDPDAETGSVAVTAVTTGTDLDSEYGVTIGSLSGTVPANGSVTIANVPVGAASVQLTGVAANCAVTGSTSESVTVAANTAAPVEFAVVCSAIVIADVPALIAQAIASMEEAMFIGLNIGAVPQLDDFSFEESNALFLTALSAAPANETALFGAAVTGIFLLEDNSRLRALADEVEVWVEDDPASPVAKLLGPAVSAIGDPMTLPLGFSTGTLEQVAHSGMTAVELIGGPVLTHGTPPSVVEAQALLDEVVRPVLIQALEYLLAITDSDFTFTVTERMQGEDPIDADPLQLDYTEILTMQAGLEAALAAVDVATSYVLTPNPLSVQGVIDAMTPGSTFLTLASGGASNLADALVRLKSTGALLLAAIDELEAETDDQTDDIIKIGDCCDDFQIPPDDLETAKTLIQEILDALSGPTVITVELDPECVFDPGTGMCDFSAPDSIIFTADVSQFFTNPIEDLKAMLAPYEVFTAMEDGETVAIGRWLALNLDEWTFPDPTANGILPDMNTTSDLFSTFPNFDEFFVEYSLAGGSYRLITVDGYDCELDIDAVGGCPVGSVFYVGGSVYLGATGDGQPEVSIFLNGYTGPPDFLNANIRSRGPYDLADVGADTYTVNMDTVLEDDFGMPTGTPLVLTATLTDKPGFTHRDLDNFFGRRRGGSSLEFSLLGAVWVFEKSRSDGVISIRNGDF